MFDKEECYLTDDAKRIAGFYIAQGLEADLALEITLRTLGEADTFNILADEP